MAHSGTFRHSTQCAVTDVQRTRGPASIEVRGVPCAIRRIRVVETNCSGEICFRSAKFQAHGGGAPIYCHYQYGNARHDCCSNRPLNRPSENITLVRFTSVHDLLILDNDTTNPSRVALDMLTHSQPHPAYSAYGDGASSSGPNPLEHPSDGALAWKDSFTRDLAPDEAVRKRAKVTRSSKPCVQVGALNSP